MHIEDIRAATAIVTPSQERSFAPAWLPESQRAPRSLALALQSLLPNTARTGSSSPTEPGHDLYHELVLRQVASGDVALHCHDPVERRWQSLSFEQLHMRCTELAGKWAAQGVGPGNKLAIVQEFGLDCAVALLTGLRLGACISLLEPGGPNYLGLRLAALEPDFIAGDPVLAPALGQFAGALLHANSSAVPVEGSHQYSPAQACALVFSPLRQPPHIPIPLDCEDVYFGALRDGALSFALRPGDRLAAPGFDATQHQPALLFAALLLGASYVHIGLEPLLANPSLLATLELRSVGICPQLCEALLASPGPRPRWDHIFKNPEDPTDWETWRDFVEQLELGETPASNLLIDAASAGTLVCSPRRPAQQWLAKLMSVTPAPGRAWCLQDFSGSGQLSPSEVGTFTPLLGVREAGDEGEPDSLTHVVLARRRGLEYLYGGTTEPRRSGRVIPIDELLAALADCPFLHGASVATLPAGGGTVEHRFVLIGFCGAESGERFKALRAARIEELLRVLGKRLIPALLPDRIELFPGFARIGKAGVDHAWCQTQYLSGALARKANTALFHRLTALRGALAESAIA